MKILHTVEFYYPSIGGAQEVVRILSERMVKMGHDVTVATTKLPDRTSTVHNGVRIVEFDIVGNVVRGIGGEKEKYQDFLKRGNFDIVMNFAAQEWAADLFFEVMDDVRAKKVLVPCGYSALYDPAYATYFKKMPDILRKYDATIYPSNNYRDIDFARSAGIPSNRIVVIPNGASEEEFLPPSEVDIRKKLGISQDSFLILHVGSHTGVKGHREAIGIFSRARIKNATFLIVGNTFGGSGCTTFCFRKGFSFNISPYRWFDKKRLIVAELSRKDTVAAYQAADLFLFPSNIECSPVVLSEAMASRTPFLTSDVGNSAEIAKWSGGAGIVLPTDKDKLGFAQVKISESARILEEIYRDPERREKMASAGFSAWKKRFTWEKIANDYLWVYKKVLARQHRND